MSSILTSSKLINSIKRRSFIPESQETFTQDDFLEMATEEVNIGLMDQIMTARGDYLVYFEDTLLNESQAEYSIPDRAHGNKLRDAHIVNAEGKVIKELTQITLEELADYDTNFQNADAFYLRNNMLVLTSSALKNGDMLRMYFYMRPNKLVYNDRAATILTISSGFETDTISPKSGSINSISTGAVITSTKHGLTSGQYVTISGSNCTPSIDGTYIISAVSSDTFSITATVTVAGTAGSWSLSTEVYSVASTNFPKHFTSDLLYDLVGAASPNKIKLYNIKPNSINNAVKTLSFRKADVGSHLIIGDFITVAEETIVPNLPTEYHSVLAQMVTVACLEAMGDGDGMARAEKKLQKMQRSVLNIVTNRVEGAPKKIKNRHGTLNSSISSRTLRVRG